MSRAAEILAAAFPSRTLSRGLVVLAALVGLLLVSLPGSAPAAEAEGPASPTAVVLDSAALRFEPGVEAPGWVLTVSGPAGFYLRQEFRGRAPRLELAGADGALLVDGAYSWELREAPAKAGGESHHAAQWGDFIVRQGVAVLPGASVEELRDPTTAPAGEGPTLRVPTHADDVYIDGHLCVGKNLAPSCTGVEVLALRTILLREDNIRVRFEDTSTSGGDHAATDWQLLANDATISGADYFAIQDLADTGTPVTSPLRIDAGAGDNAIRVDGTGEVGLGTATPGARLHVNGDAIVEGDFTAGSSREIKHEFAPIEPQAILARLVELPVNEWSYRAGRPEVRHLGPLAEEFHAAFALGRDERHISPLDLSGVAFAAIQGLHEVVRERDAEIEELRRSRDELAARIEALELLAAKVVP